MAKPLIFISHYGPEKDLAIALKRLVERSFLDMVEVFVSSDPKSLPMGDKWLESITRALKKCCVELIIASPESVRRPWINFEAGSGWIRDIPVISLCHSGMTPAALPPPLSSLQNASLVDESQLESVFLRLADTIGSSLPEVDYTELITVAEDFEATTTKAESLVASSPIQSADGLSQHELATFVSVAENIDVPTEGVPLHGVRSAVQQMGFTGVAITIALKMLERKELIVLEWETAHYGEYTAVKLTEKGWAWLEGNQDLLVLTVPKKPSAIPEDDIPF